MKFVIPIVLLPFAALPFSAAATGSATCHDGEQYRVIAKPAESAGHHFITRKKMPGDDGKPCLYSVEPGDFEIRNKNAAHFLALAGSLLILDRGTAPEPRDLILWDVEKRIKVYSGTYSGPYRIESNGIYFWQQSGEATDANCAQAARWREQGLGAAIETEVWLGFVDFRIVRGAATRCTARQ
jgi:hypothetical protein